MLYFHATAKFNFTTYDLCREQDFLSMNNNKKFVLVSTPGAEPHPWRYAHVLKILHVNAYLASASQETARRIDMLWVQWFETDPDHDFGAPVLRLECLRYLEIASEEAFGMIDPAMVICAVHVEPAFAHGMIHTTSPSIARNSPGGNWKYHYVGRCVSLFTVTLYMS
jgi:hypothetical protein